MAAGSIYSCQIEIDFLREKQMWRGGLPRAIYIGFADH
jgi:hypothetical protein